MTASQARSLHQQSPTLLAQGTGFVEDNFSTDGGGRVGAGGFGLGGNASDGERQMKPHWLTRRSPPAVWPGS